MTGCTPVEGENAWKANRMKREISKADGNAVSKVWG